MKTKATEEGSGIGRFSLPAHDANVPLRTAARRRRRPNYRAVVVLSVLGLIAPVLAGGVAAGRGVGQQSGKNSPAPHEVQITQNTTSEFAGEPQLAVDPTNPDNVLMVGTKFVRPFNFAVQPWEECTLALSSDSGETWQLGDQPANHTTSHGCGDGVAAIGPDGTYYAGGGVTTFAALGGPVGFTFHGDAVVSSSSDKGQTWTTPVSAIGSTTPSSRFVSGSPSDPIDREYLAVDQSTGKLYVSAANIGGTGQRFVTSSTDKAQSFGPIYAVDSPDYPGRGGTIAAAKGVLAVGYTASAAPGATCPCAIFETSTDGGATFDRHVVPLSGASSNPRPFIAANPAAAGRFALTVMDATGTKLQVYVTKDSGATWSGPTLLGEDPPNERFHPAIAYDPSGKIVVAWRTRYSDGKYDVWAAGGKHQGSNEAVFGAPVRVSSVAAAYPPGPTFGDDQTYVTAAKKNVYVGWGDSRTGATQIWVGRLSDKVLK